MEKYTSLTALGRMLMPESFKIMTRLIMKYAKVRRCREKQCDKCSAMYKGDC